MRKFLRSTFARINVSSIVKDHINSFYDNNILQNQNKLVVPFSDVNLFVILPSLFSAILIGIFQISFDKEVISILITSLSIFIGLLLSLLVLVFDLGKREKEASNSIPKEQTIEKKHSENKLKLVKEIFSNVLFALLISIATILSSLSTQIIKLDAKVELPSLKMFDFITLLYFYTSHFISIFLVIEFMISLLMILKRFKILFEIQFEEN